MKNLFESKKFECLCESKILKLKIHINLKIFNRNDCDEIRPNLRKHLLIDSKLCQLEQMKDQQKRQEMVNDFEEAWNEVRARSNQDRCERERFVAKCRLREGLSIQDFQKQQMSDKIEQSLKVYKELNEERKQFEKMGLEDYEKNQENFRVKLEGKKRICSAIKVRTVCIKIKNN